MEHSVVDKDTVVAALLDLCAASKLNTWNLRGKTLVPVVQGGMGVGVSAGGLAGAVARQGGFGTISSVDLRRLHPDLMEKNRAFGQRA